MRKPLEYGEGVHITYKKGSRYILGNDPIDSDEFERIGAEVQAGQVIGLPVYAYIHSGIALSTSSFGDPWDSGQSGYIYINKAPALEWQGGKVLTAKKARSVHQRSRIHCFRIRQVVERRMLWVHYRR